MSDAGRPEVEAAASQLPASGQVCTFYSYKGGVGRSMALANVGVSLALQGKRVLLVDWDLEAPGLEMYFKGDGRVLYGAPQERGVLELLEAHRDGRNVDWNQCLMRSEFMGKSLDLISAGQRTSDYRSRVQHLDWEVLYRDHHIGNFVDSLRDAWRAAYDFVLIDSRTGITDSGDLCTVVLPDILILVFVMNQQNLDGLADVVARIERARSRLPVNRNRLISLPLLSRDERTREYEKSVAWQERAATAFKPMFEEWLPRGMTARDALSRLFIPYVPSWSFGEALPIVESMRERQDPTSIGAAYTRVATLLANQMDWYSLVEGHASSADLAGTHQELLAVRKELELAKEKELEVLRRSRQFMLRFGVAAALIAVAAFVAFSIWQKYVLNISVGLKAGSSGSKLEAISRVRQLGAASKQYAADLLGLLGDADPSVRLAALDAVASAGLKPSDTPGAFDRLLVDADPAVKRRALEVVGFSGSDASNFAPAVSTLLTDRDASIRAAAATCMGNLGPSASAQALPALVPLLDDRDSRVRAAAAAAIGRLDSTAAYFSELAELRKDSDGLVRATVAEALSGMGMTPEVAGFLRDTDPLVRARAIRYLSGMGADAGRFVPAVAEMVQDPDSLVRERAVEALGRLAEFNREADLSIGRALIDKDWRVRLGAVEAAKRSDPSGRRFRHQLERLRRDDNGLVSARAIAVLDDPMPAAAAASH